jgi:sporulation protein YlmC with PRC-barrel domain
MEVTTMRTTGVMYTKRLEDSEIRNLSGEKLGTLEQLVIDAQSGRVIYGIAKLADDFTHSGKYFAVPWDALDISRDETHLELDIGRSALENVPVFDEDNWPNMSDRRWGSSVHSYFQTEPYWEREHAMPRSNQ